jgi:hypothetical protein
MIVKQNLGLRNWFREAQQKNKEQVFNLLKKENGAKKKEK